MQEKNYLTPAEIADSCAQIGFKKTTLSPMRLLILAILAGAFIAFASEGSNMAAFNLLANPSTYGLGKCLAGAIFGTGLMLVVVAGGELFTGNTLIIVSVLEKRARLSRMLLNWVIVYAGNFIGSVLIAYMMYKTGLFNSSEGLLGGITIKIAVYKVNLTFVQAFVLGILCNWLVCLGVWMSYGAKDITGKLFACFFPIWLFITSGFEHSVANMYYIPAGLFAKASPAWVEASKVSADKLATLTWGAYALNNLLPVTLGNIVGGGVFVGLAYWLSYLRKDKNPATK